MSIQELIENASTEDLKKLFKVIQDEYKKRINIEKKRALLDVDNDPPCIFDEDVIRINSESLLAIRNINGKLSMRNRYFRSLLDQNWSHLYPRNREQGKFYVYAHVDPSAKRFTPGAGYGGDYKGFPFYIGKGIAGRAWDLKRNQGHGKKIKEVLDAGWEKEEIIHFVFTNLSEQRAYEYESKLIYIFGSIYQSERKHATLYNLDIPKIPEFVGLMQRIPLKKGMGNK